MHNGGPLAIWAGNIAELSDAPRVTDSLLEVWEFEKVSEKISTPQPFQIFMLPRFFLRVTTPSMVTKMFPKQHLRAVPVPPSVQVFDAGEVDGIFKRIIVARTRFGR